MKIQLLKIGRIAYPEIKQLVAMYAERLVPFARVDLVEAKDDSAAIKLLRRSTSDHAVINLDERGLRWTSPELAARIQTWTDDPAVKSLTFVIGGPMGLSPELRALATVTWSLSPATLTSDMAWLLVWEQIYRAFNILKGTAYHHD